MTKTERLPLLQVTENAAKQIERLLEARQKTSLGIRIGLRTKGCSGLSYTLEYVDEINPLDEIISSHGLTVFVDPKAVMFLIGTTMDFEETELESGFKFINPNEKGRCGCGESFHV
ncbi:MAG: iron-sulfur cluster assembly accessory protein [Alphaproteobacteria bacterium]|nr:iron-sulfur cluster assembly accessory protein [Alphaproteobacteria bacterium]